MTIQHVTRARVEPLNNDVPDGAADTRRPSNSCLSHLALCCKDPQHSDPYFQIPYSYLSVALTLRRGSDAHMYPASVVLASTGAKCRKAQPLGADPSSRCDSPLLCF